MLSSASKCSKMCRSSLESLHLKAKKIKVGSPKCSIPLGWHNELLNTWIQNRDVLKMGERKKKKKNHVTSEKQGNYP